MILAGTSVAIAYLRSADPKLLATLKQHSAICGITRAEVLYGVRNSADLTGFTAALNVLPTVPLPDSLWDTIGLNLAKLRSAGLSSQLNPRVAGLLFLSCHRASHRFMRRPDRFI